VHHQLAVDSERVAGDQVTLDGSSSALPADANPHAMPCDSGQCREQNAPSNAQALRALDTEVTIAQ
jgi:hypothetical protein